MTTRIKIKNRIIVTISIKVKTQRIFILTCNRISANKSTNSRIIIPCPKIDRTRFNIEILTAVTERISIGIINILFNTESVVSVLLSNFSVGIGNIYNIAMSILSVVGIFRLSAVYKLILCSKACSTNIAICVIRVTLDNIGNDLLAAVPDMIDTLTVDNLFDS